MTNNNQKVHAQLLLIVLFNKNYPLFSIKLYTPFQLAHFNSYFSLTLLC